MAGLGKVKGSVTHSQKVRLCAALTCPKPWDLLVSVMFHSSLSLVMTPVEPF